MADMKLAQDKQQFAEWRTQRKHKENIPEDLWQLAFRHISELGISKTAQEFRLNGARLVQKAVQAGILPSRNKKRKTVPQKKTAFQEISLSNIFIPPVLNTGLVLERPDGMRIRI
jgi:hypothetical protein